jgi:HrpA-like RNA helicase
MSKLKAATEPEIRRLPLEEVCLNIIAAKLAPSCAIFLEQMPEPPRIESVRNALDILIQVGAIISLPNSNADSQSEKLTSLGKYLAKLPVDCRLGKMLVYGALFKCFSTTVTIVAALSASKSPFVESADSDESLRSIHSKFKHSNSDFLTLVNVWDAFEAASNCGKAYQFCRSNKLNMTALKEINDSRKEYFKLIKSVGLVSGQYNLSMPLNQADSFSRNEAIVHSIVCAGLYPNIGIFDVNSNGKVVIQHNSQILTVHKSSVNAKASPSNSRRWLVFGEKFGTARTISVSTTCFIHPFAMLLFGGVIDVQHMKRRVVIDETFEVPLAAKSGITIVKLRKCMDEAIEKYFSQSAIKASRAGEQIDTLVNGVIEILVNA